MKRLTALFAFAAYALLAGGAAQADDGFRLGLVAAAEAPQPSDAAADPYVFGTLRQCAADVLSDLKTDKDAANDATPAAKADAAPPEKSPPLPLHTIEGVGGLVITPIAYLVNPGPKGTTFGQPSLSLTYVGAGEKNIQAFAVSETLFNRIELSYALSRFGLGTLGESVSDATHGAANIGRTDVLLHHFNVRGLLVEENSFDLPTPAITAGAEFKINDGINQIDRNLGGLLTQKGLDSNWGVDYTLTASKTIPKIFGRPLILSAGIRFSEAAQIGYLGFGNNYEPTLDFNATYFLTDCVALAYEFRGKFNQIERIGKLVRPEDDWQTIGLGWCITNHMSLTVGYGHFGNVLDTVENGGWAIQYKYEF
jgi:Protein of unknown function (DUF3034)